MAHPAPIGIAKELVAHITRGFQHHYFGKRSQIIVEFFSFLIEFAETRQSVVEEVAVENRAKLPRHKKTALKLICALVASAQLDQARVFGGCRTQGIDQPRVSKPKNISRQRDPAHRPPSGYLTGYVAKRRIAAEKLVAAQARKRDLQSHLRRSFANQPSIQTVDRRLIHFGQEAR